MPPRRPGSGAGAPSRGLCVARRRRSATSTFLPHPDSDRWWSSPLRCLAGGQVRRCSSGSTSISGTRRAPDHRPAKARPLRPRLQVRLRNLASRSRRALPVLSPATLLPALRPRPATCRGSAGPTVPSPCAPGVEGVTRHPGPKELRRGCTRRTGGPLKGLRARRGRLRSRLGRRTGLTDGAEVIDRAGSIDWSRRWPSSLEPDGVRGVLTGPSPGRDRGPRAPGSAANREVPPRVEPGDLCVPGAERERAKRDRPFGVHLPGC